MLTCLIETFDVNEETRPAKHVPLNTLGIIFSGEELPTAASSRMCHLQSITAEIPEKEQWLVTCYMGDVMHLAAWAITLGGHVGIGLGDYGYSRFGAPHNGELIDRVANMSRTLGRPVATPAQTREILKIRPGPELAPS